ncbi:hypothetical protein VPH35_108051 [Triticum aestivum]
MEEVVVLIVGAGPAGLATAACRENCSPSLWRNHTYDRLKLHLAREFCELPHMPPPPQIRTLTTERERSRPAATIPGAGAGFAGRSYIPKNTFIKYVDDYIECFTIHPRYLTVVESSTYDFNGKYWSIMARDMAKCKIVNYRAKFLVVANGENSVENIPVVPGLKNFPGVAIHSSCYKSGIDYSGKNVLVIGSGNSGMEIAYDLASHGANTSIVIRSPIHVMTKELIRLGMTLVHYLSLKMIDGFLLMMANAVFGDLSSRKRRSAVIDVGTIGLTKKDKIKVHGRITKIKGKTIEFEGGKEASFDAIVFATGYKSTTNSWLKKLALPKKQLPVLCQKIRYLISRMKSKNFCFPDRINIVHFAP